MFVTRQSHGHDNKLHVARNTLTRQRTQTKARPPKALRVYQEHAHGASRPLLRARLLLGFRDKRKAGFRVPNTSGAQSGEAKQLLRHRTPESNGKKKPRRAGGSRKSRQNEQWLGENSGTKTQFFPVKTRTKEQAHCHTDRNSETGLTLPDGTSDKVGERGLTRAGDWQGTPDHELPDRESPRPREP